MKTLAVFIYFRLDYVFAWSFILLCLVLFIIHTVAGLSFVVAMQNLPWIVIPVAYPTALSV